MDCLIQSPATNQPTKADFAKIKQNVDGQSDKQTSMTYKTDMLCNMETRYVALPAKNIKVINSFYKGMHDMQRCLRL